MRSFRNLALFECFNYLRNKLQLIIIAFTILKAQWGNVAATECLYKDPRAEMNSLKTLHLYTDIDTIHIHIYDDIKYLILDSNS